ncbi:DegT/DnrJ/EryC1/StrS family aminotransferase [Candidatus Accumulibacter sp. ACC003]|uniref:DegT/DnrJ/EryC1/StrS family aminotransferase n=1 Tax=Candidatus Accumulibacter sp. ACC003 TaxID=2823334 RepID=UPI0025BDFC26|nr:DegT/DnrJ/EryC1/StrS family aminotransferase [Candidatus Accumulibacter sp. ACC003]
MKFLRFDPGSCCFPSPLVSPLPETPAWPSPARWSTPPARYSSANHFRHFTRGRYALREAFRLAGIGRHGVLLAPAYHCVTMLDPALALAADIHLYPLQADLSPDQAALESLLASIQKPVKALLATHYFGIAQDFSHLKAWCIDHDIALIEDCSHVLLTERFRASGTGIHGHFVTASPYKFFACADGGLLYAADAQRLDPVATTPAPLIEELRGLKNAVERSRGRKLPSGSSPSIDERLEFLSARKLDLGKDPLIDRDGPSSLFSVAAATTSSLRSSRFVVDHSSIDDNIRRRRENYQRWLRTVAAVPNCHALFPMLPADCTPYMFPLHIDHPNPHFHWLKHLGVPIWRWDEMASSTCAISLDYRLHLLHLPCHQALTESQMDWMTAAFEKTLRHVAKGVQ